MTASKPLTMTTLLLLMVTLLAACATQEEKDKQGIAILIFNQAAAKSEYFLTREQLNNMINQEQEAVELNFAVATPKLINLWWKGLRTQHPIKNTLEHKELPGKFDSVVKENLSNITTALTELDNVASSEQVSDHAFYSKIENYCLTTKSAEASENEKGLRFGLSPFEDYVWLARYFYNRVARVDGTRFDACLI